jgi:hypothetical protein
MATSGSAYFQGEEVLVGGPGFGVVAGPGVSTARDLDCRSDLFSFGAVL